MAEKTKRPDRELTFDQKVADALQRIIAPVVGEDGHPSLLLHNFVVVSDWEAEDGSRSINVAYGENQPAYITRALINEGVGWLEEEDEDDDD